MNEEMDQLKQLISNLYGQREQLKSDLENGEISPRLGMKKLFQLDNELSQLDTRFKQLWDSRPP